MGDVMRFTFHEPANLQTVEHDLSMALLVAEFLYGRPRVRLEAGYVLDSRSLVLVITGPAGETAARIFAGFCSVRFGEEGYCVERSVPKVAGGTANGVPT